MLKNSPKTIIISPRNISLGFLASNKIPIKCAIHGIHFDLNGIDLNPLHPV